MNMIGKHFFYFSDKNINVAPDSFNVKEMNNSLSETSYGRKNFLDIISRLDMVRDIFQNSKWWYILSISLGCCSILR